MIFEKTEDRNTMMMCGGLKPRKGDKAHDPLFY